jgi:type I restriction-modification system DNA methylase subunit
MILMPTDHRALLAKIKRFDQLIAYLRDEMGWPIESDDLEELTFEYMPEELGIDSKNAAKIESIKRLRPLSPRQPWGIFFVKFEPKRLPVVALRRILSQVTLKKRASANSAERTAWAANDLLFVSNYGEGDNRTITFAHFFYDETKQDLPVLKVLGWNDSDTALHLDGVAGELTSKLAWPTNEEDVKTWREQWQGAFTIRYGEIIASSRDLSINLAKLAQTIRKRINMALEIETDGGPLKKLMKAFHDALIHDLDADGFADMYAQTIAYGLLSARIANPKNGTADDLHTQMPMTNPFLKELMGTFLNIGGRRGRAGGPGIDFDELGVNEVVELLDNAKMEAVIRDFGDRNPQEDPVIHFYELFLKEYDADMRVRRGVFYTPRPVVSYIVRSVDEILRTEFGLQDGLADTTTWSEMAKRHKDLKIPEGTSPDQVFVQILDPATGTGTFLVETIDLIHRTMQAKWKAQGQSEKKIEALWNEYVPKHLLPRMHGYELLMAPYAIAHLKIGLKLYETGYHFSSDERVRVYLTNSLEPASDIGQLTLTGIFEPIAHEAQAVNEIKRKQRFTVVIGNPPYSAISSNNGDWIQTLVRRYYLVDGKSINERNPKWLLDDYVKFLCFSEATIGASNIGVVGLITNHGFIANPTFRGLRYSLLNSFDLFYILDLHGNQKRREESPNGITDENIFDIQQGVAISIFLRNKTIAIRKKTAEDKVFHSELWGTRNQKYLELQTALYSKRKYDLARPSSEFWLFRPQNETTLSEYGQHPKLTDLFLVYGVGMTTARDHVVIDFETKPLIDRATAFRDFSGTNSELCSVFEIPEKKGWDISRSRKLIRLESTLGRFITPLAYRPFDNRYIFYHDSLVWRTVKQVMRHMLAGKNLALVSARSNKSSSMDHFYCTRLIMETKCGEATTQSCLFPLYTFVAEGKLTLQSGRQLNLNQRIIDKWQQNMQWQGREYATPEDIFGYAYAVFHSPSYRSRYAEFLKIDFPRLPLTESLELFRALALLGSELVALHLLESPKLDISRTEFIGDRNFEVEKISWSKMTVWIDKAQTTGFKGVPVAVWNFHIGGYKVCEKWLKDRKGRTLSKDNIIHYQKIVIALAETIRLMQEIDKVIEHHGGWPNAFQTGDKKASAPPQGLLRF